MKDEIELGVLPSITTPGPISQTQAGPFAPEMLPSFGLPSANSIPNYSVYELTLSRFVSEFNNKLGNLNATYEPRKSVGDR